MIRMKHVTAAVAIAAAGTLVTAGTADAKKSKLDVEAEDGEHLAALIAKIYATPKPIVERVGRLIK